MHPPGLPCRNKGLATWLFQDPEVLGRASKRLQPDYQLLHFARNLSVLDARFFQEAGQLALDWRLREEGLAGINAQRWSYQVAPGETATNGLEKVPALLDSSCGWAGLQADNSAPERA